MKDIIFVVKICVFSSKEILKTKMINVGGQNVSRFVLNQCSTVILHLLYIFRQFRLLKVNYLFPYGKSNLSTFVTQQSGSLTAILVVGTEDWYVYSSLRNMRLGRQESFLILRCRYRLPSTSECDGRKSLFGGDIDTTSVLTIHIISNAAA